MFKIPASRQIAVKIKKGLNRASVHGAANAKDTLRTAEHAKKHSKKKRGKDKPLLSALAVDTKDFLSPDAFNPLSLNHYELVDNGKVFYGRSFYISTFPKRGKFVDTFAPLFEFKNSNCTIYIDPVSTNMAVKSLDDDLTTIEAEIMTAEEKHQTNEHRKLLNTYKEAEFFQSMLEGRENKLFSVAFIFTLQESSLSELDRQTSSFVYAAKDSGIEIISFYANQELAFKLNKPFNSPEILNFATNMLGGVKWHPMDMYSLSTICAHTSTEFYHEDGLVIGRNLLSKGHPVSYDTHDKSHSNQNVFFCGTTGYGKSSTIKKLMRLFSTIKNQKFVVLDAENVKGKGEYYDIVTELGGYVFEISAGSDNKLNPFEISDEEVYISGTYKKTLKIADKIPYVSNIILSLISDTGSHSNIMTRIVNDAVAYLYKSIGLVEGSPSSLYETKSFTEEGKVITKEVRKSLPTLTDFFVHIVNKKIKNQEPLYHTEYVHLIAGLSGYIEKLDICESCGVVTTEEDEDKCKCGSDISRIRGSFSFFDGETSADKSINFNNYPAISVDVSNVPSSYLDKAMLIGLNFILETLIKKNSEDPSKSNRVTLVNDEQHKTFKKKENRDTIIETVRIIRKRNAGLWSITQSINDYTLYDEAKSIITQSDTAFIFRHKGADRKALSELLDHVNSSDLNFATSMGIGQVLLCDVSGKARVKVDLLPSEMNFANTNLELDKKKKGA